MTRKTIYSLFSTFLKKERATKRYIRNASIHFSEDFSTVEQVINYMIDNSRIDPESPYSLYYLIIRAFIWSKTEENIDYWDGVHQRYSSYLYNIQTKDYNYFTVYFLKANRLYKSFKSQSLKPVKEWLSPDRTIMLYLDWTKTKEGATFWAETYIDSVIFYEAVKLIRTALIEYEDFAVSLKDEQ